MRNIKILFAFLVLTFFMACGGDKKTSTESNGAESSGTTESKAPDTETYDPNRGEGKHTEESLALGPLDAAKAEMGEKIQGVKCASCHKLGDERLVGPGWKGVTERRKAAWLMNFITNPDPMIDKDPELQAQLELCLVRMPNQSLSDDEARNILEFMRKNDGVK